MVKKLSFSTKLTLKTIWLNVTREEYFKLCINCNESRNDGCDIYVDQFFKGKNPEIIRPLTVMGKNLPCYCRSSQTIESTKVLVG